MTKTMQRILELVGFEQNESGEWLIELELDWSDGNGKYIFEAFESSESYTGNPRIDVLLVGDDDWEPVALSTFIELIMD